MCGGTYTRRGSRRQLFGLSPRVRGNLSGGGAAPAGGGTIPACAGEPCTATAWQREFRGLSPRVRGNQYTAGPLAAVAGLSPRVRGNPARRRPATRVSGTIPACAGEPIHRRAAGRRSGTIPACAGEPGSRIPKAGVARDYPRVCGGTTAPPPGAPPAAGLSPRVRGEPVRVCPSAVRSGEPTSESGDPSCPASQVPATDGFVPGRVASPHVAGEGCFGDAGHTCVSGSSRSSSCSTSSRASAMWEGSHWSS